MDKRAFRAGLCILIVMGGSWATRAYGADGGEMERWINLAGNEDRDIVRLGILRQLRTREGLIKGYEGDLDKLIGEIERWVTEPRLDYFGSKVSSKLDYDFGIAKDSPFEPLTWLYRGRMVTWYTLESGGVWHQENIREKYFKAARGFFEKYAKAFPDNRIAGMYLGRTIPNPKQYETFEGAPEWAVRQRESLERLADIIDWWIDNRMRPAGDYGGGWGDDCEMWRWWVPVLIGFEDPKICGAQAKFSNALMSNSYMEGGYTNKMTDVEHTAEDSADAITPMMHLDPDNKLWLDRAMRLADLMENKWTGRNQRGMLQFKSTYFTSEKVDESSRRACDTVYHPRAVQPALLYWQRTGQVELTKLFSDWMDTWVDAAASTERGKPAGIIPSAIHWPDGGIGGLGKDWWDPRNHGEYTLYLWPSAMPMMLDTMLLTYHMTGDEKYLEPIRSMAKIRLEYLEGGSPEDAEPGSKMWCAARMGFVAATMAKYRFLTGDTSFDGLFAKGMSPYMRFRLDGQRSDMDEALDRTVQSLRINFPGYTSEVRYTDRVLRFPSVFGRGMLAEADRDVYSPATGLLYSMVTGDPGQAGYFPLNAVRWLTRPRDIAAMVTDSGTGRFTAELVNFGEQPREMGAELYLLDEGQYELTVRESGSDAGEVLLRKALTVAGPRTNIAFTLPGQTLCVVNVERLESNGDQDENQ